MNKIATMREYLNFEVSNILKEMFMEIGTRRYPDRYFPVNLNLFNLFWHFGQLKLFRHERLTPKELSIAKFLIVVKLRIQGRLNR